MVKITLRTLAVLAGLVFPGAALAQTTAVVITDLNIRTGPGPDYQRYGTIPAGEEIDVFGCLSGYNWCDVGWTGGRGWVSGAYLASIGGRYDREPISVIGVRVGVPAIGFDPYDYHRRYYAGRSWYHDRYLGPRGRPGFDHGPRFGRGPGFGPGDEFADDRDGPRRHRPPFGPGRGSLRGDEGRGGFRDGRDVRDGRDIRDGDGDLFRLHRGDRRFGGDDPFN